MSTSYLQYSSYNSNKRNSVPPRARERARSAAKKGGTTTAAAKKGGTTTTTATATRRSDDDGAMTSSSASSSSGYAPDERRRHLYRRLYGDVLAEAPITAALLDGDSHALANALKEALPAAVAAVTDVSVEKTTGEAYTGGRSTPVYAVSCDVRRKTKKKDNSDGSRTKRKSTKKSGDESGNGGEDDDAVVVVRRRHFIIKFVDMTNPTSTDSRDEPPSYNPELVHLRESYGIERRFYDSHYYKKRLRPVLSMPRLVASDFDGVQLCRPWTCLVLNDVTASSAAPVTPTTSGNTESLPFDEHPIFLSKTKAKQALHYAARWHAACWGDDGSDCAPATRLWPRGGFWNAKRQNGRHHHRAASSQNKKREENRSCIATAWTGTATYLKSKHPHLVTDRTKTVGHRLQAASEPLQEIWQDPAYAHPYMTLVHGDYKAANLFFCRSDDDNDCDDEDLHKYVCAVDFQYTGHGLGAFDVAYLLYPDARGA